MAVNIYKQKAMESLEVDKKLDYRFLLTKELELRKQKNAAYSLRAFARTLNVSPAYMSQVFSGKRVLSDSTAITFSQKLRWTTKRKNLFIALLQYQKAPNTDARKLALNQINDLGELDFLELKQDEFQLVAEWYHFALVELSDIKGFKADPRWVARRLRISIHEAEVAIKRLVRIGLLAERNDQLEKSNKHHRISSVSSEAIKTFHRTHLKGALIAMDSQDFDKRDFSGTTVVLPIENIPEIKELIQDFRNKINRYCSSNRNSNAVYHLAIQFFRLDKEL